MRIRKNTTLSSLLVGGGCGGERRHTLVCQLNQSPWDVIPFSSSGDIAAAAFTNTLDSSRFLPSSSSSSPRIHQFEGDDSFNGDVSLGDSAGAAESVVSIEKLDILAEDSNEKSPDQEHADRSWRRRRSCEAKKSKAHQPKLSEKTSGMKSVDQASRITTSPPRRGRPRGSGKKAPAVAAATATNPYEFYYYSGFGPRWGKRRGGGGKSGPEEERLISDGNGDSIIINNINGDYRNHHSVVNMKSGIGAEDGKSKTTAFGSYGMSEDMEEEEDDVVDQYNDINGRMMKKRLRKPVKARSLKSLM